MPPDGGAAAMIDKSYIYYAAVIVWAVIVLWRVYHHDKYEKEPWWMLAGALGSGFAVMMFLGHVEMWLLHRLGFETGFAWKLALSAALVEDLARLILIVIVALTCHRFVNDPLDGMIYGMLIGLGMAAAESYDALVATPGINLDVVCGELFRFVGHCFLGGIVGFAILEATPHTRPKIRPWRLASCFLAAALPHFVIDFAAESRGQEMFAKFGIAAGFTMAFAFWCVMLVVAGRRSFALFGRGFDVLPPKQANSPEPAP
jgi:RsiW-degrading membrane proteinase PrsW (M82 family)